MKKGFTLLEMLAVVMVIAALSAVAVPQYRRSIERTRLSEAPQMLPIIYDAVDRFMVSLPAEQTSVRITEGLNSGWADKKPFVGEQMAVEFKDIALKGKSASGKKPIQPEVAEEEERVMFTEFADVLKEAEDAQVLIKEDAVPFTALDVSLKGQVGESPNVWETPNFTYRILPFSTKDAFVVAVAKKGKYAGTRFGYDGNEVMCNDQLDGVVPGGCALLNMKAIEKGHIFNEGNKVSDLVEFDAAEMVKNFEDYKKVTVEMAR